MGGASGTTVLQLTVHDQQRAQGPLHSSWDVKVAPKSSSSTEFTSRDWLGSLGDPSTGTWRGGGAEHLPKANMLKGQLFKRQVFHGY